MIEHIFEVTVRNTVVKFDYRRHSQLVCVYHKVDDDS